MLGYLDALIAALSVRDVAEAERLLAHPLARLLPEDARTEATGFVAGDRDGLAAPLRVMQLRHQTAELLRQTEGVADLPEAAPPAVRPTRPPSTARTRRQHQMELPLSA